MKINDRVVELSELIRNEIIARRTACGLSKNETATRAGLSVSFVSDLEHAKRRPSVETLAKLAWVFGTNPSEMLSACEKKLRE